MDDHRLRRRILRSGKQLNSRNSLVANARKASAADANRGNSRGPNTASAQHGSSPSYPGHDERRTWPRDEWRRDVNATGEVLRFVVLATSPRPCQPSTGRPASATGSRSPGRAGTDPAAHAALETDEFQPLRRPR
jgi:hypothetical protein